MKIIFLNAVIALVNIILFSNAFIHIDMSGENVVLTTLGVTIIFMSVIIFIYGNYKLLTQNEKVLHNEDIKTLDDCIGAVYQNKNKKTFAEKLEIVLNQIKRFKKKKETIKDILLQKFSETEMSYSSFQNTITELEKVMYLNIRSLLNRINAFDDEEYRRLKKYDIHPANQSKSDLSKLEIYNEYIAFVDHAVEDNEQIIIKLDKLLLEISKFNSIEAGEIENMDAMKEIDQLINNAKWYK